MDPSAVGEEDAQSHHEDELEGDGPLIELIRPPPKSNHQTDPPKKEVFSCAFLQRGVDGVSDEGVFESTAKKIIIHTSKDDQVFNFDQVFDTAVTSNASINPELIRKFTIDFLEGKSGAVVSVDAGASGSHSWLLGADLTFQSWSADSFLYQLAADVIGGANHVGGVPVSVSIFETYQEKVFDLLNNRAIMDGTTSSSSSSSSHPTHSVSSIDDVKAALAAALPHSRLWPESNKSQQRRTHFFVRFQTQTETNQTSSLTIALLAPYDPTHTEFLSKEQNEMKKSLFNLGLMVQIINRETASIGFNWRTFKLTRLLHDCFASSQRLLVSVHASTRKDALPAAMWCFNFAAAARRSTGESSTATSSTPSKSSRSSAPSARYSAGASTNGSNRSPRAGRSPSRTPNRNSSATSSFADLTLQQQQMKQLETRLKRELQGKEAADDSLKRELLRSGDLQKKLREAEKQIAEKDSRIEILERAVEKLTRECAAQIHSTDRLMKQQTESYQQKLRQQDIAFQQQTASLHKLERHAADLMNRIQAKAKNPALPWEEIAAAIRSDAIAVNNHILLQQQQQLVLLQQQQQNQQHNQQQSKEEDPEEIAILVELQELIGKQASDLVAIASAVNQLTLSQSSGQTPSATPSRDNMVLHTVDVSETPASKAAATNTAANLFVTSNTNAGALNDALLLDDEELRIPSDVEQDGGGGELMLENGHASDQRADDD